MVHCESQRKRIKLNPNNMQHVLTAKELFDKMLAEDEETTSTQMMIEFARLHVEAALKAASEKAKIVDIGIDYAIVEWAIDKSSVLKSYSLKKIK